MRPWLLYEDEGGYGAVVDLDAIVLVQVEPDVLHDTGDFQVKAVFNGGAEQTFYVPEDRHAEFMASWGKR